MTMEKWDVVVGNIGYVLVGGSKMDAKKTFSEYVKISKSGYGRAEGESVYMFCDGEIYKEYVGKYDKALDG